MIVAHALGKARSVDAGPDDGPVIGVDTDVVLDGRVFGKAGSEAEAESMLRLLGGRSHSVISAVCVRDRGLELVACDVTTVTFVPLTERAIAEYVATGEWAGRAASYAIQGFGAALVRRIDGCYSNVVGLPIPLLHHLLGEVETARGQ